MVRTYGEIIDDYLDWAFSRTKDEFYDRTVFYQVEGSLLDLNKARIINEILELCYKPTIGIYWFTKFILGDMTYAGYPTPIYFNRLWLNWSKIAASGDHIALVSSRQVGKEQPYSSKIMTPNGWTTMGEIQQGDYVISGDGTTTKVLDTFEQGTKDVYKLTFTDESTVECGLEHNWKIKGGGAKHWKVETLKQIIARGGYSPKSDSAIRIPLVQPIQYEETSHYIHPYVLGGLIGDGSLTQDTPRFTTADYEILDYFKQHMPSLDINDISAKEFSLKDNNRENINGHTTSKIINELRRLNLHKRKSISKFIPKEYLYDSVKNRIELLRGLMDTDGSIYGKCQMEYYSVSEQLSKDVQHLVQSLGGTARIRIKKYPYYVKDGTKAFCKPCYRVKIKIQDTNPFKLKRKSDKFYNIRYKKHRILKSIELVRQESSKCIMVEHTDHTYVTDNFIVTHNSTYWTCITPVYRMTMYKNYNVLISSASEDQAIDILSRITTLINSNEFLINKKAKSGKWSSTEITYNGCKVRAKGVGSEVRGGTFDLVICDDIIRSDNKLSDDDIESYVDEELEPMTLVRKGQIIIVGTKMSPTDIFTSIEDRIADPDTEYTGWQIFYFPAVLDWENKVLLCPDRFTWVQLMRKRSVMGKLKFQKEFMCSAITSGSQLFDIELIKPALDQGKEIVMDMKANQQEVFKGWSYFIGVDTARSGKASADYTVAIVIAYNPKLNKKKVVHMWRAKGKKISEQVESIAMVANAFGKPRILVEVNNMGQEFIDRLVDDYGLYVDGFTTTRYNKEELIRLLVAEFESKNLIFPNGDDYSKEQTKLITDELSKFVVEVTRAGNEVMKGAGKSKDDITMALSFANKCAHSFGYEPFVAVVPRAKKTALEMFVETNNPLEVFKF